MTDKLSVGSGKSMASLAPGERSGSGSREQSPSALIAGANLDHSMESLLASSSSEEGIFQNDDIAGVEEIPCSDEKNRKVSDDMNNISSFHSAVDSQLEERRSDRLAEGKGINGGEKKRKKRVSHRERKISVSGKVAAAKVDALKEGYLLQQGSFQRWNKKYFAIVDDRLYISKHKEEALREEIILKDMDVAENSSKNVNHSFTVITPFQQVVLAASSRKEMDEWVGAFKMAVSRFRNTDVLENLEHLEGQHSWFACTHSRPTYCNVCRDGLHGVAWNGLSCEVCKIKSHRRCVSRITDICKWTTRSSLQEAGVQLGQDLSIPHQWMEGNLPVGSKCSECEKQCGSKKRLQDFRCLWCKWTVHTECMDKVEKMCTLGDHKISILPPSALQRSDAIKKGMWEPYRTSVECPVLACVNSKSGNNMGVKFLRKLKFWLNPTQVFDMAISGPDLGLQLFQKFEKFRVIILGGDGSIGWMLSTMDKYNLHSKCMVGVVPLGTGNDMARVLGWGAQCSEEEKLPTILSLMEQCSFRLLDRWSLQYTPVTDPLKGCDIADLLSPCPKHGGTKDGSSDRQSPFPGPCDLGKGSESEIKLLSPGDTSVFSHDSASSDDYKSASDRTPSPAEILQVPATSVSSSCEDGRGEHVADGQQEGGDTTKRSSSPQNAIKISEFHKSLSGLAHNFSTLLTSEDEQNVLKSAEIIGGVVKEFLSSVMSDIETELSSPDLQDDPLVQRCIVLQRKLSSLLTNFKDTARPEQQVAPPTDRVFVQREQLMARAHSLKKALSNVMDVTGKALNSRAKDLEEIKQLTGEIGMQAKTRVGEIRTTTRDDAHKTTPSVSSMGSVVDLAPLLPEMKELVVMNNYFGVGLDAKIAYKFNETREKNPSSYKSRTKNMMLYGLLGGKEFLSNSQRYLERRLQLECDGEPVELPQRLQGLVFLNIPSYMAGTNFWGTEREKEGFSAPSHDDKLMEVVAVSGLSSIATAKVLGIQNSRLRQCRVVKLTLKCKEPVAMQVDGEAWLQQPGTIIISHKNKARMLFKDKHFTQSLETWKQKSSNQLVAQPTTPLHETFTAEDLDHYKELAASIPPLIGYIKTESQVNEDVQQSLIPYVTSVTQSLDRIFGEGGLVVETADLNHLQDFEHDLSVLIQETTWYQDMGKISRENEVLIRSGLDLVSERLKHKSSANLATCSQAHLKFRRGSDTLLVTRPSQTRGDEVGSYTPPHRHRAAQLVPDDTTHAATVARKIGKEVEHWDTDDVCQWLEGLGMREYCAAFQERFFTGRELMRLKKTDLTDLGITKVAHTTKLNRALQALSTTSPISGRGQRASHSTVHRINH